MAAVLSLSRATITREWQSARAWLYRRMTDGRSGAIMTDDRAAVAAGQGDLSTRRWRVRPIERAAFLRDACGEDVALSR